MAYLNGIYLFVADEKVKKNVDVSTHPVEKGLEISDNIKRAPITIDIAGEIVGDKAKLYADAITNLMYSGSFVDYSGCTIIKNAIIEDFNTSYSNTISGGYSFTLKLRELSVATDSYVGAKASDTKLRQPTQNGTQQIQKVSYNSYHIVKKGDTLWNIAEAYYGDGNKLDLIYHANMNKIILTKALTPGITLLIPR